MPTIAEVRQQYPQYDDLSDGQLADALHSKFYSDMPKADFLSKIGMGESETGKNLRSELSAASNTLTKDQSGIGRDVDSFMRGAADMATFGLADELAAAGGALTGIGGEFGEYSRNLMRERVKQDQRDERDPIASTAGRVAGGVGTGVGLAKSGVSLTGRLAPTAGIGARIGAGAAEGAAYGGAYGAGSGEGAKDRFTDAVGGAVMGGAIGGAVPAIAAGAKAATKPVRDAIFARTNPGGYAEQKIAERLANSNQSVGEVAGKMRDGLSIADAGGKSMRDLLRTTVNIPGKAKDRVASQLTLRQMGQGDRIKSVVRDVFADPDGFIVASDKLSKEWASTGSKLYEPALARKVVWTDRLKQFVDEPIFQRGLAQGVKIQRLESLAEGVPFKPVDYAITGFNAAGDPIIGGVPNMRTLNVAKKGIDALIGDMKNPITGKLTEEGRATDMVRRAFLEEIDRWNPEYKQARSIWGGFAKLKEALDFGQNDAFNLSPQAVKKSFKEMSEAERRAARIGIADAMRKRIDGAGFTNNAILKIFSNRQNTGVLREAFPDTKSFGEFRKAIFAEARKRSTYEAVKGNSTTAAQLADMFEAGGQGAGMQAVQTAATGRPVTATLQFIGDRMRRLGGLTPKVADEIARRLTVANPAQVRMIANDIMKLEQQTLTKAQKSQMLQFILSRALSAPAISSLSAS